MNNWTRTHTKVLSEYPKAVVNMRAQYRRRKLGLIFGAGLSKPVFIPNWRELVERIAGHPKVRGKTILRDSRDRSSHTSKVQMLYEHFRQKEQARIQHQFQQEWCDRLLVENKVRERWRALVREKVYEKADIPANIRARHPYLGAFMEVIRGQPMTVNYNFDDLLEQMLSQQNEVEGKKRKDGYQTVWDISQPIRTQTPDDAIIYHPNGFLPEAELEHKSQWLVFSEDEYADQLIYSITGYFSSLSHHLSKNSVILVGVSLEDSTLRHLLRQQARANPGHYHYYVAYRGRRKAVSAPERCAVREANFGVYNLVTLFLNDAEIKALAELITCERDVFLRKAEECGVPVKYCYYVTGAIAAGKSSLVSHFRSLDTQEEWPEVRKAVLGERWKGLPSKKRKEADKWVAEQFRSKNWELTEGIERKEGVNVIDRCPLDPLAFTDKKDWSKKATYLLRRVTGGQGGRPLQDGHVILVIADPQVMASRVKAGQEEYTAVDLKDMQDALKEIYGLSQGATVIDTRDVADRDYVKRVARVIHLEDTYECAGLHQRLEFLKRGTAK